ncbi:flavocytochrome C [Betaproteobacteria bacterium SCGC AG-212-J23]|nr:flavocytochrome C [Betaproteobacteria bacterium SCGC AG-212-J23]
MKRRDFLKVTGAASLAGCATTGAAPSKARVVVIGGGFGGATAAKHIRMWDSSIDVVLVERDAEFVSCPISNLVLGGFTSMKDITRDRTGLTKYGVQVVRDEAVAIDAAKKSVRLASGGEIGYERLVVSPGIDFTFGDVQGYEAAMQSGKVLHAWKAGPQTVALRRQLEAMRDGGVYVLSIPLSPYRCPPGPYERASLVAAYFKQAKPRSKVLVLDANPDVTSKAGLFKAAWKDLYSGILEYHGNSRAVAIDGSAMSVKLELDEVKGDVLNVVPPHRAGDIAQKAGLITSNNRWCDVDWRTMESKAVKGVHVLGDATLSAPAMPKSGSMANNHAKIAAAAIVDLLNGREPQPLQIINTCYSFVSEKEAIRVSSVHRWDAGKGTLLALPGGGVSAARSEAEGNYAWNWARTIWADSLS